MYKVTSQSGHTTYGLKEFVCNTEADIANLPIEDVAMGSSAFVITGSLASYMFDGKAWVKI